MRSTSSTRSLRWKGLDSNFASGAVVDVHTQFDSRALDELSPPQAAFLRKALATK